MAKSKLEEIELEYMDMDVEAMPLEGRSIKLDVTRILRGKGCEAKFVIRKENGKNVGKLISLEMYPSFIRRIIRNNASIIEDSFVCKTKDKELIIKPFIISRKKIHRSVRSRIRSECREELIHLCAEKTTEELFKDILSSDLQKNLSKKLKKVYPLAFCDIRVIKIKGKI